MKRFAGFAAAALLAAAGCSSESSSRSSGDTFSGWKSDLEAAKKEAKASNKLILVDFGADWCGPCKSLEEEFHDPRVQESFKKFVLVRMDLSDRSSKNPAQPVASKYGVEYIPSVHVLSADGTEITKIKARKAAGIAEELDKAAGK